MEALYEELAPIEFSEAERRCAAVMCLVNNSGDITNREIQNATGITMKTIQRTAPGSGNRAGKSEIRKIPDIRRISGRYPEFSGFLIFRPSRTGRVQKCLYVRAVRRQVDHQQNWQSSEISQIFKAKQQYWMNTLYTVPDLSLRARMACQGARSAQLSFPFLICIIRIIFLQKSTPFLVNIVPLKRIAYL